MAHKICVKRVPHINKNKSVSKTKMDYRVICKRRGHICTDETFTTKKAADDHVIYHWDFVSSRRLIKQRENEISRELERQVGRGSRVTVNFGVDNPNFKDSVQSVGEAA